MDPQKKPGMYIGNGSTKTQTPEKGGDPTEGRSIPSQASTDTELTSILNARPTDPLEALGLLQSRYFDLSSLGFRILLEASSKGKLYAVISWPGHALGVEGGHILADGLPVLKDRTAPDTGKEADSILAADTGKEEG